MSAWNGPEWIPPHSGWYRVRRDGEEKVRAYGNGHWWIPLPDGWLSADDVYEWQQPRIAPLDATDPNESPLAECKRVTLTVLDAVDALGVAIADAGYVWTPEMREAYEQATELGGDATEQLAAPKKCSHLVDHGKRCVHCGLIVITESAK